MTRHRVFQVLGVAAVATLAIPFLRALATPETSLHLDDGRVLRGLAVHRSKTAAVLETAFGPLRVATDRLRRTTTDESPTVHAEATAPAAPRETTSPWWRIESDLAPSRVAVYHEYLDAFVDWMIVAYDLDRKRMERSAPFRMKVFGGRDDFKRLQDAVAPGIAAAKGKGFAEGVAGFYDPGAGVVYLWDVEGTRGESHPTTALHETTHLLNHHLARATGIRFPVWFQEGTAVYFQTWTPGIEEPEPHLAALISVVGWMESGAGITNRGLRSVPYATYHSDEYAWGWSLVRFLRRHREGRLWAPLLDHLQTVGEGAPTDSEERRFLKTLGYRKGEALDRDWRAHVLALKPKGRTPIGTSPESLAAVAALETPTPEQATLFARLGRSFASVGIAEPALTYLRAALRGGEDGADLHVLLATALATSAGLALDETWPEEALRHLDRAVDVDPLSAPVRLACGRQRLLRARTPAEAASARDMLGLGLVVLHPHDDAKTLARWTLRATVEAEEALSPTQALRKLEKAVPGATAALRSAWIYFLQDRQEWETLLETLATRDAAGKAGFEERATLAGLYRASDRNEEATRLYRTLLAERPDAYFLWPHLVHALLADGQVEQAKAAKAEALEAIRAAPPSLAPLGRALERIRLPGS